MCLMSVVAAVVDSIDAIIAVFNCCLYSKSPAPASRDKNIDVCVPKKGMHYRLFDLVYSRACVCSPAEVRAHVTVSEAHQHDRVSHA